MSNTANDLNFSQDFVNSITGIYEKIAKGKPETHIHTGRQTLCIEKDLRGVLRDFFPCVLPQEVPVTIQHHNVLRQHGVVRPDLSVKTRRDHIGW